MGKTIGILTAGGDCPGLNAAIRGIGKAGESLYDMRVIGFRDGFRGLMQNRIIPLDSKTLSGILTQGGTILGTSRDKPHKMPVGGKEMDMTEVMIDTYKKHQLDCLVCLGGNGTQKNAKRLADKGLNVITLPKTIDNDVAGTDITFGFDTALEIATDAIDRLHSTASSHHRIIVCEIMGHRAGWLTLGAGIAGGADVILIPEIPYSIEKVAESISERASHGKRFSIVAVAEGAKSTEEAKRIAKAVERKKKAKNKEEKKEASAELKAIAEHHSDDILLLTQKLEELTHIEARITMLGHVQRGGTPSATDRLLATRLGTACAEAVEKGKYGNMVASEGDKTVLVPLEDVAGKLKLVPADHQWIESARRVGTSMGD